MSSADGIIGAMEFFLELPLLLTIISRGRYHGSDSLGIAQKIMLRYVGLEIGYLPLGMGSGILHRERIQFSILFLGNSDIDSSHFA